MQGIRIWFAIASLCVMGCSAGSDDVVSSGAAVDPAAPASTSSSSPSTSDPVDDLADPPRLAGVAGAQDDSPSINPAGAAGDPPAAVGDRSQDPPAARGTDSGRLTRVPLVDGVATPENTTIQFVGTHVGPNPDPRTGVFTEFSGTIHVDLQNRVIKSVSVDVQTGSLTTAIPPLTNHLRSPDFFDVREHPTASFRSTGITALSPPSGEYEIAGELTLLGTIRPIRIPVTVALDERGLTLRGVGTIDRTEFGMDRFQERVNNEIELTVVVGQRTQPPAADDSFGAGPGRGSRRARTSSFDE